MIGIALLGAAVAGCYGMVHDQVSYAISPEYFQKLKFRQFGYADFGFGERGFVTTIGFLASWWVGFFAAWFLARRFFPGQPRSVAYRQSALDFACILMVALLSGSAGFAYGLWRGPTADYSSWESTLHALRIVDTWSFVRVAYLHQASYLGGLLGLIIALVVIRPEKSTVRPTAGTPPS